MQKLTNHCKEELLWFHQKLRSAVKACWSPVCPVTHDAVLTTRGPCIQMSLQKGRLHRAQKRGAGHPECQFTTQERVPAGGRLDPEFHPHHPVSPCRASAPSCKLPKLAHRLAVGPCDQPFLPRAWSPVQAATSSWNLSNPSWARGPSSLSTDCLYSQRVRFGS